MAKLMNRSKGRPQLNTDVSFMIPPRSRFFTTSRNQKLGSQIWSMVVFTVCLSSLAEPGLMAVFDRSLFDEIKVAMDDKLTRAAEDPLIKQDENLQLEQDVIVPLAASRKVYVFETTDFWRQMKTAACVPLTQVPLNWS